MSRAPKSRRKQRGRLRAFWLVSLILAIAIACGLYAAATWQGFRVRHVIVQGNRTVSAREIARRAGIATDENVWLQNMGAVAARVAAIPYVGRVSIHRSLPANVRIVVTERKPYAVVAYGAERVRVDADLRVLDSEASGDPPLPVFTAATKAAPRPGTFISDPAIRGLDSDYSVLSANHVAIARLWLDKFGDLDAQMRDGIRLLLGDDADLAQKSRLIAPVLSQAASGGRRIATLDLRASKTPVVVYSGK